MDTTEGHDSAQHMDLVHFNSLIQILCWGLILTVFVPPPLMDTVTEGAVFTMLGLLLFFPLPSLACLSFHCFSQVLCTFCGMMTILFTFSCILGCGVAICAVNLNSSSQPTYSVIPTVPVSLLVSEFGLHYLSLT